MLTDKTLSVSAIKNGTVIDHINANSAISILRLLQPLNEHTKITLGINLPSKSTGYKDVIKFEDKVPTDEELIKIAVMAPLSTVNIISNYEITEKFKIHQPISVGEIFKCPNICCITNHEPMKSLFHLNYFRQESKFQCHYCRQRFIAIDFLNFDFHRNSPVSKEQK